VSKGHEENLILQHTCALTIRTKSNAATEKQSPRSRCIEQTQCYPCRNTMRLFIFVCLCATIRGLAQTTPELPKEPREILTTASHLYDFSDPALKPWHLKATYQLYDEKDHPSEKGTYEYWWASPSVYRSTWARPGTTHTVWHTADGNLAYAGSGSSLNYFEYKLEKAFLSPLPDTSDWDEENFRLSRETLSLSGLKLPCVMVIPKMPVHGQPQNVPLGLFPTYCFDAKMPILRISYSFGTVTFEFNKIVKVQNRFMAREILMFEGKRRILSAEVDSISSQDPADAVLAPSTGASVSKSDRPLQVPPGVAIGFLRKKEFPIYPQDAKSAHVSGEVVLRAHIGMDGGVHDLHVVSTPWPSLTGAALLAVSHWEYNPYLVNGQPVEVDTTIKVVFSLGQ
jgi:TonB family protein